MKVHAWSWRLFLENHRHFHLQDVIQPLSQGTLQREEQERALSLCTVAAPLLPPLKRGWTSFREYRKLPFKDPNFEAPHPCRLKAYLLVNKKYI